ncbi:hypothetical protein O988_06801 [Pseudogymnoascus sp. VKM F-3808]|nr:hypothetical protein O988_06801 [Pseudogymnoascus sp. VKM F-3808]
MKPHYQTRIAKNKMRPSEDERDSWYFGIDARMYAVSMLVARSSTYPFQKSYTKETQDFYEGDPLKERKRKTMSTIGSRKIIMIYDDELRPRVREILSGIKWKTIDVVRLGYRDEPSYPVILITVDINDVDENTAQDAVNKIHELMVKLHLPVVHAEIKTGRLFEQARHNEDNPYSQSRLRDGAIYNQNEHYPLELARVPKLGAGISGADSSLAGSLCLFLKIDGSNYAMACQHVPPEKDLEYDKDLLDWSLETTRLCYKKLETKKQKADRGDSAPISKDEEAQASTVQDELKQLEAEKIAMESSMTEVQLPFGTVGYAPSISKHPVTDSRRDWDVIKLNDDRFQTLPPNLFPPMHFTSRESRVIKKACNRSVGSAGLLKGYSDVATTTILPQKEFSCVLNGPIPSENQDYKSLLVLKHRRTSGWTAGSLNEIRSDCRFESESATMEYCVVNIPTLNFFSYQGDSGACVIYIDGRIIGMIHSGNGENVPYGAEITYLTPMEWTIQDIKDMFKTDDVVIEQYVE